MKKLLNFLILAALSTVIILSLVSCADGNSTTDSTEGRSDATEEVSETKAPAPSCKHEASEWIVAQAATCSSEGLNQKKCTSCQAVLEEATVGKTAHTEVIISGKAPTCSEGGLSEGKKCSVCNEILVAQNEIAALAHTVAVKNAKNPTCLKPGATAETYCSECFTVIKAAEEIPALGHTSGDWIIDKVAEVGSDGSRHKECVNCNEISVTESIPAIDESHTHSAEYWSVTTTATCKVKGIRSHLCSCGYALETEEIAKVPHTELEMPGIAPTCKSIGFTTGKKCSVCGEVIFAQTIIAMSDHIPEAVLGKSPTCTEAGTSDGVKCSFCGIFITSQLPIPPKGHSFEKSVCTDCGATEPFGIWIVDGFGNPVSDVIVKLFKDGEQIKMLPYSGQFVSFDIEVGTYTVELDLSQLDGNYVYDKASCVISPDKRSLNVRLFESAKDFGEMLFVGYPIELDYPAKIINIGSYKVTLTPNDYNFFVFTPKKAATYTFTYECDSELSIGYHGSTFFVQGQDLTGSSQDYGKYENGIFANIYASNIGGSIVIAIRSTSATECILNVRNVGDPGTRLEDEPWTPYLEDEKVVNAQLSSKPEGTFTQIDLTDLTVSAVYNKEDGYYHLNSVDGPIIYIDLTSNTQYISSVQTICANQRMGAYIRDINGKVTEKRSYNELFHQYGMPSDTSPVDEPIRIPLTAKLAEAIQSFGEQNSWWAEGSEANIFTSVLMTTPYNRDFAWLLYCGTYQ